MKPKPAGLFRGVADRPCLLVCARGAEGLAPCADGLVTEGASTTRTGNADRRTFKSGQETSAVFTVRLAIRPPAVSRNVLDTQLTARSATDEPSPEARSTRFPPTEAQLSAREGAYPATVFYD